MKEKRPLPVYETGNGGEQIALEGFEVPQEKSTTGKHPAQEISALLLRGAANAVSLRELEKITGLDGRTIRRKIQTERQGGRCICCDNQSGYYLAVDEYERDCCARSMIHRAAEIQRTARAIAAAEVGG